MADAPLARAQCYLYNQPGGPGGVASGQTGDGTQGHVHYSSHMCFPATPYAVPRMASFGETVGVSEDYDWSALEYEEMCDSRTVKALIGPMMGDLSAVGFLAAPYGSMLRIAEGIDSIRNLGGSSLGSNYTEADRAASVVCGFAQFGGVLWLAITLVFLSVFASCAGVCGMCCVRGARWCRGGHAQMQRYEDALHEVLLTNIESGRLVDTVGLRTMRLKASMERRQRRRARIVRPVARGGLVLLPQEP